MTMSVPRAAPLAPLAALAAIALVAVAAIMELGGREPAAAGGEAGYRLLPAAQGDLHATPARSIAPTPLPAQAFPPAATSIWSTPAEFAPPE